MADLITCEKQPYEERKFSFNFASKMAEDATITSINSITSSLKSGGGVASLTINGQTAAGQKVEALYGGGTTGQTYKVTCKVTDSQGQELELDGLLKVKEQ